MVEPNQEIVEWLLTLRLSQYASCFQQGGYEALDQCKDLTDERLLELRVLPTGHRRRILRSLEALGVKQQSGGEDDEEDGEERMENGRPRRKPKLYPRHVFLKDKKRGTSCQHHQLEETRERDFKGTRTLPPGAGLAMENNDLLESTSLHPPQPAPRNPQNISTISKSELIPVSMSSNSSSSSSSESLSISEIPSDWEISPDDPSLVQANYILHPAEATSEDLGGFRGEMVENSIYEVQPSLKASGPRLTRSYRLRHRPVPKIPCQTVLLSQERSAPPAQTTSPEHQTSSEGPTGANSIQKVMSPIAPYGETFLYNSPESTADHGANKEGQHTGFKDKRREKKKKERQKLHKQEESKDKGPPAGSTIPDPYTDEYSTVEECSSVVRLAGGDQPFAVTSESPAASGPKEESLIMVDCDLYSEPADAVQPGTRNTLPDISPYACFYGAPKHKVLKMGWLDKLSPQGNCVFQRRWVRFDGESLAYYNSDKEMYSKGMILASAIRQVRGLGDNKFEVVTSLRTFIFRAEREGERQEWMETLQTGTRPPPACGSQKRSDSLPRPSSTNKRGLLELRGYKGRVLVSLAGSKVRLCKTEQDFRAGLAIAEVELTAANIRDIDRRGFDINTPFKNFW